MAATRASFVIPLAADAATLPGNDSPDLELVLASSEEQLHCSLLNSVAWAGPLSLDTYIRREDHLATTDLAKTGLSIWILVDKTEMKTPRTILAACETFRKRALIASKGQVRDGSSFGIASVYVRSEYRGKGYAVRLMKELRKKLEYWMQEAGARTDFSVLFSDIGKKFYAKTGWIPYASAHVSLPPVLQRDDVPGLQLLKADSILELCERDKKSLRQQLANSSARKHGHQVAEIPTAATMAWHHTREEFVASTLSGGRVPEIKGAIMTSQSGASTWCIWTRSFSENAKDGVLYILRIVIEGEKLSQQEFDATQTHQIAACLSAAQEQASLWGLSSVHIWNPSPTVLAACKQIHSAVEITYREEDSIPCLNRYGDDAERNEVEWVAIEKYAWC